MGLSTVACLIIISCVFGSGASPSSRLELPIGFNRPVRASYMISLLTAAYNDGVFSPILSSERFVNRSDSGPGFSFGFFFNNVSDYSADHNVPVVTDIYLGVCVGRIDNKWLGQMGRRLVGRDDLHSGYDANWSTPVQPLVRSGYAVPVWVANSGRPLRSVNASLMVVDASSAGGSNKELQLRDFDGTVLWSVGNVGMMEMQDETGNLVIYDTSYMSTSDNGRVVWQSFLQQPAKQLIRLALAAGQPFSGKVQELVISDGSSMEPAVNIGGKQQPLQLLFKVLVALLVGVVLLVVLVQLVLWILRRRSFDQKYLREEEQALQELLPMLPTRFSFEELQDATQGFATLLGAGGCGSVYAGVLPDGRKVAVKNLQSLLGGQTKQLLAEVASIGRTRHHNIVRLVGFCWEHSHRLLVYEYVERGSLDRWIFQSDEDGGAGSLMLDWPTRYNVALGMARGLTYLHDECTDPILHFDIKPENILLDDAFSAKLADFGMSKLMQRDISHVVTDVRGTPGYIAPEWLSHGAVGKKCDVYSMGMVMMEIIGGRKNCDFSLLNSEYDCNNEWHFPSWAAMMCQEGMMMEMVDKRLQGVFDEEQAERFIKSAFWCIQEDPNMRPYAHTVVQWLEGSSHVQQPPFSVVVPPQSRPKWISAQSNTLVSFLD